MIEKLVRLTCDILALILHIMIGCFEFVLAFVLVVMTFCLVWWILDEMQKR